MLLGELVAQFILHPVRQVGHILRGKVRGIVNLVNLLGALNSLVAVDTPWRNGLFLPLLPLVPGTVHLFKTILRCIFDGVVIFNLLYFFLLHRTTKFVGSPQVAGPLLG